MFVILILVLVCTFIGKRNTLSKENAATINKSGNISWIY
jgi:hypothetical protein